jgi:hypothetical protein
MDHADRFIQEQNLSIFMAGLRLESDPVKRRTLRSLLIEEVDRCGARADRLLKIDILIVQTRRRLEQQQALLAAIRRDGLDSTLARSLLENLIGALDMLHDYRTTLVEGFGRAAV